jgi:hypothetical protein
VKKLHISLLTAILGFSLVSLASAQQDHSFTYTSTAGMFEDQYDFFKFSPAYLPSFKQTLVWTQLSNLHNGGDELINGSAANYYLLGAAAPGLGGGLGAMIDWTGQSQPQDVTNINGQNGTGFVESTQVQYRDNNNDGIFDTKITTYGREKEIANTSASDIYAAYALGDFMGLDLGAALRIGMGNFLNDFGSSIAFQNANYTYNPNGINNPFDSNAVSFDENIQNTVLDITTGNATSTLSQATTGSLDVGNNIYRIYVGGRAKDLLPDLDLVVNVGPAILAMWNKYDYTFDKFQNFAPGNPMAANRDDKYSETGVESDFGPIPGSFLGVTSDIRADYSLAKNIILTGTFNVVTVGGNATDSKLDRTTSTVINTPNGPLEQVDQTNITDNDASTAKMGVSKLAAGLRGQYLVSKVFKFGMGLRYNNETLDYKQTTVNQYNSTRTLSGTGTPVSDLTTVTTRGDTTDFHGHVATETWELPVGMVIQLFDNLPIRFGASHVITVSENDSDRNITSRTPQTTVTTDGNGAVTQTVNTTTNTEASSTSDVSVTHNTYLYHGATWWPTPNVQIDLTNIIGLASWQDYQVSITLHF